MTQESQEGAAPSSGPGPQGAAAPRAVLVTGPAGSGKTTLGTALARRTGAVPLDLDSLTNPLLDALGDLLPGPHWLAGPHAGRVRDGRYAALLSTARDVLAAGRDVVLIAPFTAELAGGGPWEALRAALDPAPVHVLHLTGPAAVLAARRAGRGEGRDTFRSDAPSVVPVVAHTPIDVLLSPAQQEFRALATLGERTPLDPAHPLFAQTFDAVLLDVDGTLVDSTPAVLRSWARLAAEFSFPADAVQRNHGMPARALLERLLPADLVDRAIDRVEEFETTDVADVVPLPGVVELLADLPPGRGAVVTSATRPVLLARMTAAGLTVPDVVVARDDVTAPKPDPEPFLRGAAALGVDPARCLVFEDAPAGVAAAVAAGCRVVAVAGTSRREELAGADLVVDYLAGLRWGTDGPVLRLRPAPPTHPS